MSSIRWWKNGDHPHDNSTELVIEAGEHGLPIVTLTEGEVVRRFRHPDVDPEALCFECGAAFEIHGWIDSGDDGVVVHPGDFVDGDPSLAVRRPTEGND